MIVSLLALASLTGCATVYRSNLEVYCPPIAQYDETFSNNLADELAKIPADYVHVDTALSDYVKLRDKIRLCVAEREKI